MHTQSKREYVAARWLKRQLSIETFLPRIRYRRAEARGAVWTTEALFPTYVFARFDLGRGLAEVGSVPGVIEVVRFGMHCPAIPAGVIEGLRAQVGPGEVRVVEEGFVTGEPVRIVSGPLSGLEAVVSRVLPARQRVSVLLDFLGRQTVVELAMGSAAGTSGVRKRVIPQAD